MQTELFPQDGIVCPRCGAVSPTEFMHTINHEVADRVELCTTQRIRVAQYHYALTHAPDTAQEARMRVLEVLPEHRVAQLVAG